MHKPFKHTPPTYQNINARLYFIQFMSHKETPGVISETLSCFYKVLCW